MRYRTPAKKLETSELAFVLETRIVKGGPILILPTIFVLLRKLNRLHGKDFNWDTLAFKKHRA